MKKWVVCFALLLFFFSNVSGQSLQLNFSTSKTVYVPEDQLIIFAEVYNFQSYPVNAVLEVYLTNKGMTYPTGTIPLALELDSDERKRLEIYNLVIEEEFPSGEYFVFADLYFNDEYISNKKIFFQIKDSSKNLEFNILTCENAGCSNKKKVFAKDETVFINFDSEVENPLVEATLTLPDQTTQQLSLPTSIIAEQIGTYTLDVSASKEGYKTVSKKTSFGVILKHAEIEEVDLEALKSPKQTQLDQTPKPSEPFDLLVPIILGILVIFLVFIGVLAVRKKK